MGDDSLENKGGFAVLGIFVAVTLTAIVDGFIVSRMWSWFIVPLGVRPIGIAHAIGLDALWKIFFASRATSHHKTVAALLASWFWRTTIIFLLGYVAHVVM